MDLGKTRKSRGRTVPLSQKVSSLTPGTGKFRTISLLITDQGLVSGHSLL